MANQPGAEVSLSVAASLLAAGAMAVRVDEPFRLPSGWASPVYMNCRRLASFPALRAQVVAHSVAYLKNSGCLKGVTCIAGAESSGIALAAWIAQALDLPMVFVRKKMTAQGAVEGVLRPGEQVLLIDDLMAAGHSKAKFHAALVAAGARLKDVFVVFDYGTFDTASLLSPLGLTSHALARWSDVLQLAVKTQAVDAAALAELQEFLAQPAAWSETHGGRGASVVDTAAHGDRFGA